MAPVQGVQVRVARSLMPSCHDEGEDNARMSSKRACTSAHLQLHKSFPDQRNALISERLLNLLNAGLHWTDRQKENEASSACRMTSPARLSWLPPRKGPAWGQTVAGGLRPEPAGRSLPCRAGGAAASKSARLSPRVPSIAGLNRWLLSEMLPRKRSPLWCHTVSRCGPERLLGVGLTQPPRQPGPAARDPVRCFRSASLDRVDAPGSLTGQYESCC